jgi:hypothetical protein
MGWTLNESLLNTTATAGDTTAATVTAAATAADCSSDATAATANDADASSSQEQQQANSSSTTAAITTADSQSVGTAKHAVRGWKRGFSGEDKARLAQLESELSFEDIMLFRAMAERVSVAVSLHIQLRARSYYCVSVDGIAVSATKTDVACQ